MLRNCNYLNWLILIFVSCSELTEIESLPIDNIPDQESWEAIIKLKLLNSQEIRDILLQKLTHENWLVRWCIAEKLGELSDIEVIKKLVAQLQDSDAHVRKNISKALLKIGPKVVDELITYLDHPNARLREEIHIIIDSFGLKIISTNCKTGPKEILKNGKYGKLFKVGDYKKLSKLILNSKKRNNLKIINDSRFNNIKNLKKYKNILEEI